MLLEVFVRKAPRTVIKRLSNLQRFVLWVKGNRKGIQAFPVSKADSYSYLCNPESMEPHHPRAVSRAALRSPASFWASRDAKWPHFQPDR